MRVIQAISIAASVLVGSTALAQSDSVEHASVRLIPGTTTARIGDEFVLGIHFEMDPGWHIYWRGLNDSGFPLQWKLDLPEGWVAGEPVWPAPERHISGKVILDHVYYDNMTVLIPVQVSSKASSESSDSIAVNAEWLICQEACIPGSGSDSISLSVAPDQSWSIGTEAISPMDSSLLRDAALHAPKTVLARPFETTVESDTLVINARGAAKIMFYPRDDSRPPISIMDDAVAAGSTLRVPLKPGDKPIRGIVEVVEKKGGSVFALIDIESNPGNNDHADR